MDTKLKILFTVSCVIAIITVIFASLISSVLYKREQYLKNPYYFCDGTWECCANEANCDVSKSVEEIKASGLDTYYVSDIFTEGSAYHQNCILPIMNYVNNYDGNSNPNDDISPIYSGSGTVSALVYGKGCTGPGGTGKCGDSTYNPQSVPVCQYHSFDAPNASWPTQFRNSNSLPSGVSQPSNSTSLEKNNYFSNNFLNSQFNTIQGTINSTYAPSITPANGPNPTTSGSNFAVPLTNPNINSSFNTLCLAQYNVLRPDQFGSPGYINNCPNQNP
jgi:hypothetical protein